MCRRVTLMVEINLIVVTVSTDSSRARRLRRKLGPDPREPGHAAVRLRPHAARARALPDDGAALAQLRRQLEDHRQGELLVRGARHRLHPQGRGDHQAVRQPARAYQHEVPLQCTEMVYKAGPRFCENVPWGQREPV